MSSSQVKRLVLSAAFTLAVAGAAAALSFSPAFASGGSASGGGGGGGGGSSTPTLSPAAQIAHFGISTGKYQSWAAIWTSCAVKNTGPSESLTVTIEEVNQATGETDWARVWTGTLATNGTFSQTFDNDFAPWETTYLVKLTVTETSTGAVLATQSAYASTGVQKL